jgi:hypothetical protein
MTIWTCTRCGSPNGSITEACFRCGTPRLAAPPEPGGAAPGPDEPSLVPLARYDVLPPGGQPVAEQPAYQFPRHDQLPPYEQPAYQPHDQHPPYQPDQAAAHAAPPVEHPPYHGPPVEHPPYHGPPVEHPPYHGPPVEHPPYHGPPVEHLPYPPPPGQQYPVAPASTGHRRWWVPVLVALVVLLAAGAVTTVLLVGRGDDDPTTQPSVATSPGQTGATGEPTSKPPSAPVSSRPGSVGLVGIDPAVSDPRVVDVATMFDTHFAAVNAKNYARALSVYDPAGVINPNDQEQAADFQEAVSTTTDSQIVLRAIGPSTRGVLDARVTFRSNQQAGYGPRERPSETCTAWDVTYSVTQPSGSAYKILAGTASSAPC